MKTGATLSECRRYRFALWRIWDDSRPYALFIGLNPSTADETSDDPTITRCINFARDWGYGGVYMANLFAYRATHPGEIYSTGDPIGAANDDWLKKLSNEAGITIAAWGNHGSFMGRSKIASRLIKGLYALKINKSGEPAHPLYLPASSKPTPFTLV
jgi:hypothetical protein